MAVTTASELCQLIEKSNILASGPLEKAKKLAESEADAKSLARTLIEQKLLTSWQARQLMAGVAGLRMGKYVLLDELGRGDLGRVYLAEHTQLVRRAALKLLSRELCENKELLRRFLGEARLIASLDHPNVVHTLDVSSEGERYYVVFEYVAGRNLTKLVADQGRLTAEDAAALILQVAEGLVHAHEKGVVHADLKPGNLMVDGQGNIKILDIGVDRLGISLQAANAASGRPATAPSLYRAPELAQSVASLSPQSDLFSLGMVFVFLVTGENPPAPDADLGQSQSDAILSQLSVACPDLPEELTQLCGKLTSELPADRLESAVALRDTLRDWLAARESAAGTGAGGGISTADQVSAEESLASHDPLEEEASEPAPVVKILPSKGGTAAKPTRPTPSPTSPAVAASPAASPAASVPTSVKPTTAPVKTAATAPKPTHLAPASSKTAPGVKAGPGAKPGAATTSPAAAAGPSATGSAAAKPTVTRPAGATGSPAPATAATKPSSTGAATAASAVAKPKTSPATAAGSPAKPTSPSINTPAKPAVAATAKTVKKPSSGAASNAGSDSGSSGFDPLGEADSASLLSAADTETAAVDSSTETSLSFTVKTGGKRAAGKGVKPTAKAKPKAAATVVEAAEGDAEAVEGAEKPSRKIPIWVWIVGGSGVAGVTLIVIIIALMVLMFGNSEKPTQVAQAGGNATTGNNAAGGPTGGADAAAAGAAEPVATEGGPTTTASAEGTAPAGAVDPLTGNPVAGTPAGGTPDGAAPAGAAQPGAPATAPGGAPADPLAILLGGGNSPAATPGTTPNPAAPGGTPAAETPAGKPDSPMPNPSPAPTTPAAKPTTPPPPPPPKPAPKPMGDPLKDFPKEFIELPALAKDAPVPEPVALGKVVMPPKSLLIIHLLGGDGAIKGKSRFVMEAADGGTAERDWDIFLREGEAESGGVKVAHLSLKENDLMFSWEADAPNHLASPHLINCMLQLAAGPKQATVALRKPLEVEPLKAEILKGTLKGKFDVPFPPNPDRMKVDIVFDGPFPPLKFEGQNPMDADKGKATVWFGASQETQILALRLDTAFRRQLEVGFDPHVRIGTTAKPEKLTAVGLGKMQKQAQVVRQQTFAMVEMAKKATAGKNDETTQQRLSLMESQLTGITKASEQLEGLKGMAEQLLQGGRIHVRVFCQVDDFKLELVRTAGIPAAAAQK